MVSGIVQGFVTSKIQPIVLRDTDIKKYSIDTEEFAKVDKNQDGIITSSEFLSSGLMFQSIFNAYRSKALENDAFITDNRQIAAMESGQGLQNNGMQSPQNLQNRQNRNNNGFNLNHPNVSSPSIAQSYDYLA